MHINNLYKFYLKHYPNHNQLRMNYTQFLIEVIKN